MTSSFDRQTNCLSSPERELVTAYLLIFLDPVTPGIPDDVYALYWLSAGGVGGVRELEFRAAWQLTDVPIEPFVFVVNGQGAWYAEWVASIEASESDPSALCVCNTF